MIRRPLTDGERAEIKIIGECWVTDEALTFDYMKLVGIKSGPGPKLDRYNCFAFCFGLRYWMPEHRGPDGGPALMRDMGYLEVTHPPAAGPLVVMFHAKDPTLEGEWHVTKRLRGDWCECRCGDGVRIVHRLSGTEGWRYGPRVSYWIPGPTAEATRAERLRWGWEPIEDSEQALAAEGFFDGERCASLPAAGSGALAIRRPPGGALC
jgi:hypothetical protein